MCLAAKVADLLAGLTPADVQALPPIQRRRFADMCRHWAALADHNDDKPKAGVLARLSEGERAP